jgi:hypothetical protein
VETRRQSMTPRNTIEIQNKMVLAVELEFTFSSLLTLNP